MKINRIELCNFGPYEGINEFDINKQSKEGRIVLIGGKNGAGKTTLFTAIRLCMYGYREGGYQSPNSYYMRKVKRLINESAKREEKTDSWVIVDFSVMRGTEIDTYVLKRSWHIESSEISEQMEIMKNGERMFGDDINDFENYLLSVVPPELFDLYFFDGEKIADFFLEDGSNSRIKRAFLILCGYDNFEIMHRNFKRLGLGGKLNNEVIRRYTESKERLENAIRLVNKINTEIEDKHQEIASIKSELDELERRYRDMGGVTMEEWNDNFLQLKYEEQYREDRNEWIKKAANEIIPFIILKDQLIKLSEIVELEGNVYEKDTLIDLCKKILQQSLTNMKVEQGFIEQVVEEVSAILPEIESNEIILGLSLEEKKLIRGQLYGLLKLDKKEVLDNRREVRASIMRSKKIREVIENSSVSTVQDYFRQREELLCKQVKASEALGDLMRYVKDVEIDMELQREIHKRDSRLLEDELKKESLGNITARALILLDKLQERLFSTEIRKVEAFFMCKIKELARKKRFVDDIRIDDEFNVHLFKIVKVAPDSLAQAIRRYDETAYIKEYGIYHWKHMLETFAVETKEELLNRICAMNKEIAVKYELDKSLFSNGEKQVYIMTLYWSIMRLCKQEVPFIIDTPFARIDSEHRTNITEKFFNDLSGQVFIFSTNEEIVGSHLEILLSNVQARFMLENVDNEKTTVCANSYFGG